MAATLVAGGLSAALGGHTGAGPAAGGQDVTFRSKVDLVSVSAVVRDKHGRIVETLQQSDFEVFDEGTRRQLRQFHSDTSAPAHVALLVDGSGSMALAAARQEALQVSTALLDRLTPGRDAAALLSFDTRLLTLCEFTNDFTRIQQGFDAVDAFGATSLYDAIAGAAAHVADRAPSRRAVIALTDGADTTSVYSAEKVAWMASTIDVPVYVFGVGDAPESVALQHHRLRWTPLAQLARATGGDLFVVKERADLEAAVTRVADELRHQYLLVFEPAKEGGLRRLDVRTRRQDLRVTARAWYQAR